MLGLFLTEGLLYRCSDVQRLILFRGYKSWLSGALNIGSAYDGPRRSRTPSKLRENVHTYSIRDTMNELNSKFLSVSLKA